MNADTAQEGTHEKEIYAVFLVSLLLKSIVALAETFLGVVLLFTDSVTSLILRLAADELIEDPSDFVATHLKMSLAPSQDAQHFAGLYLVSHGVVKFLLVAGLLKNKRWAYPASLAVFAAFIVYQMLRWLHTHSGLLLVLTAIDLVVMWLIWHEYRRMGRRPA